MVKTAFQPPSDFDFDLICIGSGTAGGSAAVMAAKKGLRTALVESTALGGESPNYSCIPTNAFLQVAKSLNETKIGFEIGIEAGRVAVNWEKALAFKNRCIKATGVLESAQTFEKIGINILKGQARFMDPWTIEVAHKKITGRYFLIATGSESFIPSIPGLNKKNHLTFKEALNLESLPASIFIIGGGTTGCAMAEIFQAFGVRVYLAESHAQLLQREDAEVGQVEAEILKKKGVHVYTNCRVESIKTVFDDQKEITVNQNGQTKNIIVERILVATGKLPRVGLNLESAQVQFDDLGIKINQYLQTSAPHIYAAGDVIGDMMLTHMATYHSRLALHNMLKAKKDKDKISLDYAAIPRCLFLTPEIAATGLTEKEIKAKKLAYKKSIVPIHTLDRSYLSQKEAGFVKLLTTRNNYLIGASIIAPQAVEMITQVNLAIQNRLNIEAFQKNMYPFTSWSTVFSLACQKLK